MIIHDSQPAPFPPPPPPSSSSSSSLKSPLPSSSSLHHYHNRPTIMNTITPLRMIPPSHHPTVNEQFEKERKRRSLRDSTIVFGCAFGPSEPYSCNYINNSAASAANGVVSVVGDNNSTYDTTTTNNNDEISGTISDSNFHHDRKGDGGRYLVACTSKGEVHVWDAFPDCRTDDDEKYRNDHTISSMTSSSSSSPPLITFCAGRLDVSSCNNSNNNNGRTDRLYGLSFLNGSADSDEGTILAVCGDIGVRMYRWKDILKAAVEVQEDREDENNQKEEEGHEDKIRNNHRQYRRHHCGRYRQFKPLMTLQPHPTPPHLPPTEINGISTFPPKYNSSSNTTMTTLYGAAGDAFGCYAWDVSTGQLLGTFGDNDNQQQQYQQQQQSNPNNNHPNSSHLHCVTCLPDNHTVLTGGENGIVGIWDGRTRRSVVLNNGSGGRLNVAEIMGRRSHANGRGGFNNNSSHLIGADSTLWKGWDARDSLWISGIDGNRNSSSNSNSSSSSSSNSGEYWFAVSGGAERFHSKRQTRNQNSNNRRSFGGGNGNGSGKGGVSFTSLATKNDNNPLFLDDDDDDNDVVVMEDGSTESSSSSSMGGFVAIFDLRTQSLVSARATREAVHDVIYSRTTTTIPSSSNQNLSLSSISSLNHTCSMKDVIITTVGSEGAMSRWNVNDVARGRDGRTFFSPHNWEDTMGRGSGSGSGSESGSGSGGLSVTSRKAMAGYAIAAGGGPDGRTMAAGGTGGGGLDCFFMGSGGDGRVGGLLDCPSFSLSL